MMRAKITRPARTRRRDDELKQSTAKISAKLLDAAKSTGDALDELSVMSASIGAPVAGVDETRDALTKLRVAHAKFEKLVEVANKIRAATARTSKTPPLAAAAKDR